MAKIVLAMFATLDGFVEDADLKMVRPEWSDDLERFWSAPNIDPHCTLLYGANAFRENAKIWPSAAEDEANSEGFRALARRMNALPKVVVSDTISSPGWNAEVTRAPLSETVRRLRKGPRDVIAVGGVTLAANLVEANLVDEYRLLLLPTLLGSGHSLFKCPHARIELALKAHRVMDTGAVLLTYASERASEIGQVQAHARSAS